MPFEVDGDPGPPRVEIRPSAVLELDWLLSYLHAGRRHPNPVVNDDAVPELRAELESIWDDGYYCLPDLSILAQRVDALLTDEADSFLEGFERAVRSDGAGLELRSESAEDRAATLVRLQRLRDEPARARRYARFLARVWELARPEWESTGRSVVRRACAEWAERIRRGERVIDLCPGRHVIRKPHEAALLDLRPLAVVSPIYYASTGGFVVDMTTYVHVGAPARPADTEGVVRKEADVIASRLKVLSDGTRVALLRHLAGEPASVMDLARRFRLAQPTISSHVRLLRDAGLLDARRDGARVVYTAPRDRLDQLLGDTRHLLLER